MDFIDTHAHYDHKRFNKNREEFLQNAAQIGVTRIVNPAISFESNYEMRLKLENYEQIFYAAGIHPNRIDLWSDEENLKKERAIRKLAAEKRTVAIGETGLDYYRVEDLELRKSQMIWMRKQIEIAVDINKPLILHIRNADEDAVKILEEYAGTYELKGVVHCFGAHPEFAAEYLKQGLYLGIGGLITYENSELYAVVQKIPLERILLETDAPFVSPKRFCSTNDSLSLPLIAGILAEIKGVSVEEIVKKTTENAVKLLNL